MQHRMREDFFRNRLDEVIDLKHPLAVLAAQLPWEAIHSALEPFKWAWWVLGFAGPTVYCVIQVPCATTKGAFS